MEPAIAEQPGRLLVVDDDEGNRDMLSRRLARRGHTVSVAIDGPHALAAIEQEPFDVILLDIEMPGMNGMQVLEQLRRTHSPTQLPVIIATAHGDREDVVKALSLGANDFVTKPIDFPVVAARVQTQLALKTSVDRIVSLEADLRRRNVDLEHHNKRMKRSLDMASRMQQLLLPAAPFRTGSVHTAWVYRPCDELGGDILNFFPLGPGHIGLYLLDVSGHGVPAALLSVTLSRLLAPIPNEPSLVQQQGPNGLEPREPLAVAMELNRRFMMSDDNNQYFTLFYGVLDLSTRQLRYVSAGHPPAVLVPEDGDAKFIGCEGFAIGWLDDPNFEQRTVELTPGSRLFVYSDGLTDALSEASEPFGNDRLTASCGRKSSLEDSLTCVMNEVDDFRGARPAPDDISALALEIMRA